MMPGEGYIWLLKMFPEIDLNTISSYLQKALEVSTLAIGGTGIYAVVNQEKILFNRKFTRIMKAAGIQNKFEQRPEVLKTIKKNYGYDCIISVPEGFDFQKVEDLKNVLECNYSAVVEITREPRSVYMKIVTKKFDDNLRFQKVKTKPHELYLGTTYYYKNIVVDMRKVPHLILGGATNTGKTVLLFTALTNLIINCSNVDVYIAQVSEKSDYEDFKNCNQVKSFTEDLESSKGAFNELVSMIHTRHQEFNKVGAKNINEYNDMSKKKMHYTYLFIDEFSSFMPRKNKNIDSDYELKQECMMLIDKLLSQGRSAGIYIVCGMQRTDNDSIDGHIKANFNVKISFRQNNEVSSRVMLDNDMAIGLENREAVINFSATYYKIKTKYLDSNMIKELIKDSVIKSTTDFSRTESLKVTVIPPGTKQIQVISNSTGDIEFT